MKIFSRQIYSYNFHICKLNNLKVINDLYSQYLTQILSKTTFFTNTKRVYSSPSLAPNRCLWIFSLKMDGKIIVDFGFNFSCDFSLIYISLMLILRIM